MQLERDSVLIFGRLPPPFGGVTVHILRLVKLLNSLGCKTYIYSNLKQLYVCNIWHIHVNDPIKRLFLIVVGCALRKHIVCTLQKKL